MKTYFTRDIRTIFFLVKHLKFLPFKYQNFVHVPQKYSDVQPHTTLKLCYFVLGEIKGNRDSKLKKGLFNVERVLGEFISYALLDISMVIICFKFATFTMWHFEIYFGDFYKTIPNNTFKSNYKN